MKIQGELRCLNCGRLLADLVGDPEDLRHARLTCPTGAPCLARHARRGIVCRHCGGRPVLEEIERVGAEHTVPAWALPAEKAEVPLSPHPAGRRRRRRHTAASPAVVAV